MSRSRAAAEALVACKHSLESEVMCKTRNHAGKAHDQECCAHQLDCSSADLRPASQVRLALELVFEGLQAAGLPGGGSKSGSDESGQNTAQQSLRIGDAVTVTLAAPQQPPMGASLSVKQPAAKADGAKAAADSKAAAAKSDTSVPDAGAASQPAQHLLLEWQGGALPDMLADAVIAVLLQVS
jgi:hypothetical protein